MRERERELADLAERRREMRSRKRWTFMRGMINSRNSCGVVRSDEPNFVAQERDSKTNRESFPNELTIEELEADIGSDGTLGVD